ncbi:hypothetical protein B0H67DRAFT_593522 [Lasiosphaeris hirsuta]|uniref:Uncharacterized protein n=1 Tax=Lasiosphaeris hirsuta TaxID=260670 RepID=A0AA40DIV1_9PEZI|nr:hypothetical protein B0H67DRAFT_593522 [Lasiosphaeris hirsuta]
MSSLVSDFIINPVLRQARRFSSGFATDEPPALQHRRTASSGENSTVLADSILEDEGSDGTERIIDARRRAEGPSARPPVDDAVASPGPPTRQAASPRRASAHNLLNRMAAARSAGGVSSNATTAVSRQHPTQTRITDLTSTNVPNMDIPSTAVVDTTPPSTEFSDTTIPAAWTDGGGRSKPLPEDDGHGPERRKILAIQDMDISQSHKARLMHQVMTEKHEKSLLASARHAVITPSEALLSQGVLSRPEPAGPLHALKFWSPAGDGELGIQATEADRRPTYVPNVPPPDDASSYLGGIAAEDHGQPVLGCEHYRRNVKLQCATCGRWYTCRFCHDAAEDHVLPRKETKNMLCMLCGCPQKASDTCTRCGESAAYYFCGVCKLWNDDPNKAIYHCNDCGLCRVGQGLGKDFFHCKKCSACISMTGGHKCIERSIDCDCPICGDYMFNSQKTVIFMQCGHSIHRHCFEEHMRSSYKCPICNKSCINMEYQFRNYDMAILTQPMPTEYQDSRAVVSCNDCSAKSQTAYHWLGLKCTVCNSYNTVPLQLLNMPGQDQQHRQDIIANSSTTTPAPATGAESSDSRIDLASAPASTAQTPLPTYPLIIPMTAPPSYYSGIGTGANSRAEATAEPDNALSQRNPLNPAIPVNDMIPGMTTSLEEQRIRERARQVTNRAANPSMISRLFPRSVPPDPAPSSPSAISSAASAPASVVITAATHAYGDRFPDLVPESGTSVEEDTAITTMHSDYTSSPFDISGLTILAPDKDDSDFEEEEEEHMLDFWGRSGATAAAASNGDGCSAKKTALKEVRTGGVAECSGRSVDGEGLVGVDSEEEEEESSSDEDYEEEDEEDEIVLFGHR